MIKIALKLVTPPATEPISLAEAKAQLRVDGSTEDTFITSLIIAAREHCEGFQKRAYITQTYDLWLDNWPRYGYITIPRPPLQSVTYVKYYGTDDTEYTFATADYFVDDKSDPGRVSLGYSKIWPTTTLRPANAVAVRFVAGYGNASSVPQKVKQAMLLLIAYWFDNREAVGSVGKEIAFSVHALLWQDRLVSV